MAAVVSFTATSPTCAGAAFNSAPCSSSQGRRSNVLRGGKGLPPVKASWKDSYGSKNVFFQDGHQLQLPYLNAHVSRRDAMAFFLGSIFFSEWTSEATLAQPPVIFREYVDAFDGYSFIYPRSWIQVRGAGADIFYRDPFVLDENLSVELSSPSSSRYKSVEDLGSPQEAGDKVLKQYLTEFMSTRLGVRRESSILSTTSKVADDGKLYYQVEANIKSYANNNELAVMPEDRVVGLEWDRRYLSVLGVENNRLYELRLQTPENVFREEEEVLRQVMDSFRVTKVLS